MSYLLGRLSEVEEENVEKLFFADDQEFEQLEVAETELIDAYIRNELSSEDRRRFEQTLTRSPRLNERVELGRLLANKLTSLPVPPQPVDDRHSDETARTSWFRNFLTSFRQPAFAFSVMLLLLTASLLLFIWTRYQTQSQLLTSEAEQRQKLEKDIAELKTRSNQLDQSLQQAINEREELLAKLQEQRSGQTQLPSQSVLLFLLPGSVRGEGGSKVLRVPPTALSVTLDLDVSDGNYSSYSATLQSIDGKVVLRSAGLRPIQGHDKKSVRVKLESKLLPPGDYILQVEGITKTGKEPFNYYPFRIGPR
jgi:hypothetical protein